MRLRIVASTTGNFWDNVKCSLHYVHTTGLLAEAEMAHGKTDDVWRNELPMPFLLREDDLLSTRLALSYFVRPYHKFKLSYCSYRRFTRGFSFQAMTGDRAEWRLCIRWMGTEWCDIMLGWEWTTPFDDYLVAFLYPTTTTIAIRKLTSHVIPHRDDFSGINSYPRLVTF